MNKSKYLRSVLLLGMIIAVIVGCGYAKAAPEAAAAEKNTVLIQDYMFQPAEITIRKGETVTWINQDSVRHTATGKYFDSGLLSKGQSFAQTFNEAGTFDYICTPHPNMKGRVLVQ
ncbi:MAG: cupredoxin family copper-binding protein [Negativicutes bacterium]